MKFQFSKILNSLAEDIPTNNVGTGNIDGLGVGPKGEPGVYRKRLTLYRKNRTPNATKEGSNSKRKR